MRGSAVSKKNIIADLLRAIFNIRHISQIYRVVAKHADHQVLHIAHAGEEISGFHEILPVQLLEITDRQVLVSRLDLLGNLQRINLIGAHAFLIENDAHLTALSAGQLEFRHIADFFDLGAQFSTDAPQLITVVMFAPEGEGQHRHIINRFDLDERRKGQFPGHFIHMLHHGAPEFDQALFGIISHIIAGGDKCKIGAGGGIHILNPGDFIDHPFQRLGHPLFHLFGTAAGEGNKNIHHRHHDLRFFFPGGQISSEHPDQQRRNNQERGQF